jgi:hypothetical protein
VLGDDFHLVHQKDREPGDGSDVEPGQGHSLASRWPVGEVRELDLRLTPSTEGFACGTLAAEILAPEPLGPLVFAFHNPSWKLHQAYERELQAVAAARFLAELADARARHVTLAADLDADPESASARFWTYLPTCTKTTCGAEPEVRFWYPQHESTLPSIVLKRPLVPDLNIPTWFSPVRKFEPSQS